MSRLDPPSAVHQVGPIARTSRVANRFYGITGVLVFDGERFCQYLEGAAADVAGLFARIEVDTRHTQVQVVHRGEVAHRQFGQFSMGYADLAAHDVIGHIGMVRGPAARAAFVRMSDLIDIGT